MRKKCFWALAAALLLCALCVCHAQSYVNASNRINFYYQYDGGGRSEQGVWDALLRDRLLSLTGHPAIYYDSSTDQYLTGRGCCLFSYAHAYQYLLGYAPTQKQKADILYNFLAVKPVWSNKNSSISPPGAHAIYASYLLKQSGVNRYKGDLSTFSSLKNFFEGSRSVLIVNAPGHYIIAVGATKYKGTEYVQVVDSILSATVRDSRITYGMSKDFSVKFTQSNAAIYAESVHEYWIPYDQFVSKCTVRYAFYVGSAPVETPFKPVKSEILLPYNGEARIEFKSVAERLSYESLNSEVCQVDESGKLTWISEGRAEIRVKSLDNFQHSANIYVYCLPDFTGKLLLLSPNETPPDMSSGVSLPNGAKIVFESATPAQSGVYTLTLSFIDPYGDTAGAELITAIVASDAERLTIPYGVKLIEEDAFNGVGAKVVIIPSTVREVRSGAFSGANVIAALVESAGSAIAEDAFPENTIVFVGYGDYLVE